MTTKKPKMGPFAARALAVAQQILANEEVRRRLAAAPKQVIDWAAQKRATILSTGTRRFKPSARFGQKGLERRVDSMASAVLLAFPGVNDPGKAELIEAIERLRVALSIAEPLPVVKRKRAHARIDNELDALELALVDAVLPKK